MNLSGKYANKSTDQSVYEVHVYVTNKDNERLKVSLFIDSELRDTKEISSDSELKINSYPLTRGPHNFKITWWDEDVKKSHEMEELKDILEETSVNLYTSSHKAPEKFDISVKLTNENRNELDACLYVDGSFEKSKVVGKESTTELGTIKLEEGGHNLSVRWLDKDTRIEYEKTKKITVTRDEAAVFYAPQGISFDAKQSPLPSENAVNSGGNKETASPTKETTIEKSTLTRDTSNATNELLSKSITKAEAKFSNLRESNTYASEKNPLTGGAMEVSDKIYLYAILVIVAVYLILRH
ncbi:MAG: hypothetical protein JW999_07250 [Methanotrichaceae archaeon]|nr:hypothetical protein [Methanotrichaceae archaeon]